MIRTALLSVLLIASAPAFAIYKCEKNGAISYSDEPCPGGKPIATQVASNDDSIATRQLAHDEKKLKQLQSERHKREKEEERDVNRRARNQATRHKKCASLALRTKWANEDAAAAAGKSATKAKRNARRAEERYGVECGS